MDDATAQPPCSTEYQPPAVLWEQEFVALAAISAPPCDPGSDPNCTG